MRPQQPEKYNFEQKLEEKVIDNLILHPEFLKIATKNATDYIGYGFAHLSYGNYKVSKIVADQLLKQINNSDYEKIEACLSFGKPFLSLDDSFKYLRAEWLFGYSSLMTTNALPNKMNRFGLCNCMGIYQDVYTYLSPLQE